MMAKSDYIQQINLLQNQLNVHLATKYQNRLDNQLTAKQLLLLELISSNISSTKEIAQQLDISTSAVSQLLNKLEEKGYITRTVNPKNRREILLKLSKKGESFFREQEEFSKEIDELVYGKLPEEDLQQLANILKKLNTLVQGE